MRRSSIFLILSITVSLFIIFLAPLARFVKPFTPFANYLLGNGQPTSYLVLLGNDAEMRANGGFVGSYAKIVISSPPSSSRGATRRGDLYQLWQSQFVNLNIDLSFQDIYVPNGQLKGYVAPPVPIQEAFQHGTWELANADWEPDFPTSANTLRWFFEKGGEINPDNLIILNLSTIRKILDVVGSFDVPEYQANLTPDNLYLFLQGKVEMNFFPGSTQKKDVLTAVGQNLKKTILKLPLDKKYRIAQILYRDLVNQNIVINSNNEAFQNLLLQKNFAGHLSSSSPDTYLLVETNLGANKANAYVERQTTHTITFQDNRVTHSVTVKFQNSSPQSSPNPPFQYGGDYQAFLRFYIPKNAEYINIDREIPPIADRPSAKFKPADRVEAYGLTELGFWLTTPAQGQTTVTLSFSLPISAKDYSLTLLKQHGFVSSPQTITIDGKTLTTNLENDFLVDR